jgi:hypothetical protein
VGWRSALICLASAADRRRGELLLSKRAVFFAVDFADFNKTEMQLLAIVD